MNTKWIMGQLQWTNTLSFTGQWPLELFSAWWTKAGSFLCSSSITWISVFICFLREAGGTECGSQAYFLQPWMASWLNGLRFEQTLEDGEAQGTWRAAVHGVAKTQTWLSGWTTFTFQWPEISHINMLCCKGLEVCSPWWGSCFSATSVHVLWMEEQIWGNIYHSALRTYLCLKLLHLQCDDLTLANCLISVLKFLWVSHTFIICEFSMVIVDVLHNK